MRQMSKVAACGLVAAVVDALAMVALIEFFHVHVTVAAFAASGVGAVANFLANKFWGFGDDAPVQLKQISAYGFVSLGTWTLVAFAVHVMHGLGTSYLLAKAIAAVGVFFLWSYPAQARFVFPTCPERTPRIA